MTPGPRRVLPLILSVLTLAGAGGCGLQLDGEIDSIELGGWDDVVFWELRGQDPASSTPLHPFKVLLLPFEDGCTEVGAWMNDLRSIRAQLDDGLAPEAYCTAWSAAMTQRVGDEGGWVASFRLDAEPMPEDEDPERTYPFHDEFAAELPDGPVFDATLVHYPTPSWEACAEEFTGSTEYGPTFYEASGGEVVVRTWESDERLAGTLNPTFEEAGEDGVEGRFDASFCPAAGDWPMDMVSVVQ